MKIFSSILGAFLLFVTLCFALSNPQSVQVAMWPLSTSLEIPLYLAALGPLLMGLICGSAFGWLMSMPHRFRARRLSKELDALNDRIDDLQKTSLMQQAQSDMKKPFWERKA